MQAPNDWRVEAVKRRWPVEGSMANGISHSRRPSVPRAHTCHSAGWMVIPPRRHARPTPSRWRDSKTVDFDVGLISSRRLDGCAVPPQSHEIGVDPPLSQICNLDTAFLDVIHKALLADARSARAARPEAALAHATGRTSPNSQEFPGAAISQSPAAPGQPARASGEAAEHAPGTPVLPARASGEAAEHAPAAPVLPARASGEAAALADLEGRANDLSQQVRTLYYQQNLSVTMRALLPPGLFGLFALLLFLAMLSTDDTRIYSAALTLAQDVVLPLRKKPFTPRGHIWMIRIVSIGIGVVFLAGSCWMKQMDYYNMFVVLICAMWEGGAGAIMTLGLYTRFGTTAGAWTASSNR